MQSCTIEDPGTNSVDWVDVESDRWWETTYTRVSWQYPPPADVRLSAFASGSRLLRIAYSSGRGPKTEQRLRLCPVRTLKSNSSDTPTSTPSFTPTPSSTPTHLTSSTPFTSPSSSPPKSTSLLPCLTSSSAPTSAAPSSSNLHSHKYFRVASHPHYVKHHQKKYQWSKPPHYHASLLRSPLPRRRGRFRAILPPTEIIDFFRWEVTRPSFVSSCSCGTSSSSVRQGRYRNTLHQTDTLVSQALSVAESTLAPYEACAGFFGWRGLGLEVQEHGHDRRGGFDRQGGYATDQTSCSREGDSVTMQGQGIDEPEGDETVGPQTSFDIATPIDEEAVEEGRVKWAEVVEGLVGSLGSLGGPRGRPSEESESVDPQRSGVDGKGDKPMGGLTKADANASLSDEPVRWDPDLMQDNAQLSHVGVSNQSSKKSISSRPPNTSDSQRPSSNVSSIPSSLQPPNAGSAKLSHDIYAKPRPMKDPSMRGGWWFPPPPPTSLPSGIPQPPARFVPWYGAVVTGPGHQRVSPHPHPSGWWYGINTGSGAGSRGNLNASPATISVPTTTWLSGDPDFTVRHNVAATVSPLSLSVSGTQPPSVSPSRHLSADMNRGSIATSDGEAVGSSEADRGYESTTDTCTDSDPVPRTPTGTGDQFTVSPESGVANRKDSDIEGTRTFVEYTKSPVKSPPERPLSLLTAAAPSDISGTSAQRVLVFPSLNGTFRQTSPTSPQLTPAAHVSSELAVRVGSASGLDMGEDTHKSSSMEAKDTPIVASPSPSSSSFTSSVVVRQASLSPILSLSPSPSSSLSTSPAGSNGFRKDPQGFWEPVTPPISPGASLSTGVSPRPRSSCSDESSRSAVGSLSSSASCLPRRSSLDSSAMPLSFSTVTPASPSKSPSVTKTLRRSSLTEAELSSAANSTRFPCHPAPDVSSPISLLPAFLASAVKRKKGSRTREIVDRLKLEGDNGQPGLPEPDLADGVAVQGAPMTESDSAALLSSPKVSNHTRSRSGSCARSSISGLCSELGEVRKSNSVSSSASTMLTSPGSSPMLVGTPRADSIRKSSLGSISNPDHSSPAVVKASSHPKVSPTTPASTHENGWIELGADSNTTVGTSSRGLSHVEWPKLGTTLPPKATQPTVPTTVTHPPAARPHMSSVSSPSGMKAHLPPIMPPPPLPPQPMVHPQAPPPPLPPQMFAGPYLAYPQYGYPFGQFRGPVPPQGQMQGQGTWVAMYQPPQTPQAHIPQLHPAGLITGTSGMRHVSW